VARPTIFSEALADEICERLVAGESLRKICKRSSMPAVSTVCRWLAERAPFQEQYARARELQADTLADEVLYIADTPRLGIIANRKFLTLEGDVGDGASGGDGDSDDEAEEAAGGRRVVENRTKKGDMLGHRRLQIDARKWLAAKLAPKKYGDHLELGGRVGVAVVLDKPKTEDEWAQEHAPG
jgi:hypothetical protein